jgi:hypothetical protein
MAWTPLVRSPKWNIISLSTTLQMTWPNSGMVFSIQIKNAGNGEKDFRQRYIAWTQFVTELYERFDTDTNHLGRLTKLKQSGIVEDFIATFEHLFPLKIVSSQNCKPSFIPRPKLVNPTTPSTPLKIQKLTRAKMAERQLKGLCYNCDEKYFLGHKCK